MLKYLVRKEFIQLRRDRKMLPLIFVAPLIQLVIFGYAAITDVRDVRTVVCDRDRTPQSRDYLGAFFGSGRFTRVAGVEDCGDVDRYLDRGEADLAIVTQAGFGRALAGGATARAQAIVGGADSNVGTVGLVYAMQVSLKYATGIVLERFSRLGAGNLPVVSVEDRVWYNPELESRNFMVPAILAMIMMIMTLMLTAMAVVREKEIGTIEQLVVTPVRSWQIVVGKLLPFTIIGFVDLLIVTAVAVFWFKVPLKGSVVALLGTSMLFLLNTLGLGLLVSTVSRTQQQAMMTVMFVIMMPFIYLSGFIFPIENMPEPVQYATYAIPLKYYLTIIRGIFLKGVGPAVLWKDAAALAAIGAAVLAVAVARFRKRF